MENAHITKTVIQYHEWIEIHHVNIGIGCLIKDTRKRVVEVQIDGAPVIRPEEKPAPVAHPTPASPLSTANPVRLWIDIRTSNGLHLSQKNLSYHDLVRMVEKLEGLC